MSSDAPSGPWPGIRPPVKVTCSPCSYSEYGETTGGLIAIEGVDGVEPLVLVIDRAGCGDVGGTYDLIVLPAAVTVSRILEALQGVEVERIAAAMYGYRYTSVDTATLSVATDEEVVTIRKLTGSAVVSTSDMATYVPLKARRRTVAGYVAYRGIVYKCPLEVYMAVPDRPLLADVITGGVRERYRVVLTEEPVTFSNGNVAHEFTPSNGAVVVNCSDRDVGWACGDVVAWTDEYAWAVEGLGLSGHASAPVVYRRFNGAPYGDCRWEGGVTVDADVTDCEVVAQCQ